MKLSLALIVLFGSLVGCQTTRTVNTSETHRGPEGVRYQRTSHDDYRRDEGVGKDHTNINRTVDVYDSRPPAPVPTPSGQTMSHYPPGYEATAQSEPATYPPGYGPNQVAQVERTGAQLADPTNSSNRWYTDSYGNTFYRYDNGQIGVMRNGIVSRVYPKYYSRYRGLGCDRCSGHHWPGTCTGYGHNSGVYWEVSGGFYSGGTWSPGRKDYDYGNRRDYDRRYYDRDYNRRRYDQGDSGDWRNNRGGHPIGRRTDGEW